MKVWGSGLAGAISLSMILLITQYNPQKIPFGDGEQTEDEKNVEARKQRLEERHQLNVRKNVT